MSQEAHYYKIGLFAIITFAILVIFLILLGAKNWFTVTQYAETYFDVSVQGLEIGSPVKYRGVTVGKVEYIDLVNDIYGDKDKSKEDLRYIYVKFSLSSKVSGKHNTMKAIAMLHKHIKEGLRTTLATADLVGNVYLSLKFVDPKTSPMLPIDWTPQEIYIPSSKSTLSRFSDSLDKLFNDINSIDFKQLITHFDNLVTGTTQAVNDANIKNISSELSTSLNKIGKLSQSINDILSSDKADHMVDSLSQDSELLETTLATTSEAMRQLNGLILRANQFTASEQKNLNQTMGYISEMSSNLEIISNKVKNDPSTLVFSQPVTAMEPGK